MNRTIFIGIAVLLAAASVLAFHPPAGLVKIMAVTDVTAKYAKSSFAELLAALPPESGLKPFGMGWIFSAPDGSAEFFWTTSGEEECSVILRTPSYPFLEAGMDPSLLPDGMLVDDMLIFGLSRHDMQDSHNPHGSRNAGASKESADFTGNIDWGDDKNRESASSSFAMVIDSYRERFGYHFQFGHFGVELDGGNLLEWAEDLETNNLDLVFVLDPEIFLRAGVNKDLVKGWVFGTV
ncbi:MAG: hypothetical protein FWG74_06435, partial [Planctomycetes bacterium]|nr:hypothetical protein [Planctomycetota bacterium]